MSQRSSIDLSQFPDSRYADELRAGVSRLRFAPILESAYQGPHLDRVKTRVRVWSLVSALMATAFTVKQVEAHGPLHLISLIHYLVSLLALLLAIVPWTRHYRTHYLRVAQFGYPLLAALTAPFSAQAAAEGHYEVLMQFALQIVGMFEFSGMLFRSSLITGIALVAGFAGGTVIWQLPPDAAAKYIGTAGLATLVAAVAFRGAEIVARTLFLEGHLFGELLERDPLTGLKNRRSFDEQLHRAWMQAQRDERTVAVLMVDVDEFKRYNDLYGHQAGDEALRRVGGVLRECGHRPLDVCARYGGEEFALVLYDVSMSHAREVAEHVRKAVAALGIPHGASTVAATVTLSVGVAVSQPALDRTPEGLVQMADEALYKAKASGRNGVVVKGPADYGVLDTGVFTVQKDPFTESTA